MQHRIRGLVVNSSKINDIFSIDYKRDLLSGIRLKPEFEFTNDGLLKNTKYYYETEDKQLVVFVDEEYVYSPKDLDLNPSERAIIRREKKWHWTFQNGEIDNNSDNVKVKPKNYDTYAARISIGTRRRKNIIGRASENIATVLVLTGKASSTSDAVNKLRVFSRENNAELQAYSEYADTEIYNTILNLNLDWLQAILPTVDNLPSALIPYKPLIETKLLDMQGVTVKDYLVLKLKGLVK